MGIRMSPETKNEGAFVYDEEQNVSDGIGVFLQIKIF